MWVKLVRVTNIISTGGTIASVGGVKATSVSRGVRVPWRDLDRTGQDREETGDSEDFDTT